jgi:hypothetical protein
MTLLFALLGFAALMLLLARRPTLRLAPRTDRIASQQHGLVEKKAKMARANSH